MPSATRKTRSTVPFELLQYVPAYRILVCKECRYAIQPSAISSHLQDLHHIYRSDREQLLKSTQGLDLVDPANAVLPAPHDPPVSLLPTEKGLACAENDCNHLCITVKRMKNHWATVHKDLVRVEAAMWHPVTLQTFFRGNQLRYFRVKLEHITTPLKPSLEGSVEEITVKPPPSTWSTDDITLYNQFIDSTNHTLTPYPNSKELWKTVIPQMAYEHDFLKYGILACSALHLAYLAPSQRQKYHMIAATYQDQALHLFRAAIANPNERNCNALLVFSQLLVVHCFAFEEQDEGLFFVKRKHDSGLPEWLQIIRSSCTMFSAVQQTLANGILRPLIEESLHQENFGLLPDPDPHDPYTKQLFKLLEEIPLFGREPFSRDTDSRYVTSWRGALLELIDAFKKAQIARGHSTYTLWTAVRIWPARISIDFLDELRDRDPAALVLLAHYCLLLEPSEDIWYINGFKKRLLMRIYGQLDEEWLKWLKWPFEMAGIDIRLMV